MTKRKVKKARAKYVPRRSKKIKKTFEANSPEVLALAKEFDPDFDLNNPTAGDENFEVKTLEGRHIKLDKIEINRGSGTRLGELSAETRQLFKQQLERAATAWFKRIAMKDWESIFRYRWLEVMSAAARFRILTSAFEIAAERGDPLPASLVRRLAKHMRAASHKDRAAIDDFEAFKTAADYRAEYPKASLNELAHVADVPRDTVRHWLRLPEFKRFEAEARTRDEGFRRQLDKARREDPAGFERWLGETRKANAKLERELAHPKKSS
jgi:hypothetical protein